MTYRPRRRIPPIDRILSRCIESPSGCWLFTGHLNNYGYAQIDLPGPVRTRVQSHRYTWEYFRETIPTGLYLDHLCRMPQCVNPWHLEPVTNRENIVRGNARYNGDHNRSKTHCKHGHEFVADNVRRDRHGHRHCVECERVKSRDYQRRLRAARRTA